MLGNDHTELDALLEDTFAALAGGDHSAVFARLDYFWARLAMHIRAEHLHLFPAILHSQVEEQPVGEASIDVLIEQLRVDHNFFMTELAGAVKTMREILQNVIDDPLPRLTEVKHRLKSVRIRLVVHNDIEEARVYPLMGTSLSRADSAEIYAEMKRELDNLPPRFIDHANTSDDTAA